MPTPKLDPLFIAYNTGAGRRILHTICISKIVRISAMRYRVISQPRRHFFGVRHGRLAKAE
jgi:hypothetical protein